jgi:hypothetical protein
MNKLMVGVAALGAALLLGGCGTTGAPSVKSSSPASPTVSPSTPKNILLVVADPDRSAPSNQQVTIRLLKLDGTEQDHFILKSGVAVLAAAGQRVFVLSGGHLKAVRLDGSVEDLGSLGTDSAGVIVPSPDGTRWLWSTYVTNGDRVHSQVHLGGDGIQARVVEDVTDTHRVLEPYSWTARGAFVQHMPMGIGGYILFSPAFGPVDRLDPSTWTVTPDTRTTNCSFSDEASNGTIACFSHNNSQPGGQFMLLGASGSRKAFDLPRPLYTVYGDAYFNPTNSKVSVGGSAAQGFQGERFGTGLVNIADGSFSSFGPSGVRPAMGGQSWLPDGRFVAWRPRQAAGGAPGLYVLDASGNGPFIATSAGPVGWLES